MRRRVTFAIGASLALHLLFAVGVVGSSLWRGWPSAPVDVEIVGMRIEDLNDLPLGAPRSGGAPAESPNAVVAPPPAPPAPAAAPAEPDRTRRKPDPKPPIDRRAKGAVPEAEAGPAPPRPTSVRSYAPEGSRVTALMRIDRLRDTPYAAAVDELLLNLPDRRDLLEGTDVDLYRDVDALLIATPNPLDARVTFLAVRHRLSDVAMRAALDRGARATGRKLIWRTERGRPFAERRAVAAPRGDSAASEAGAYGPGNRDHRLILLAAPHLVVVTPPAYRSLILGNGARADGEAGAGGREARGAAGGGQGGSDVAAPEAAAHRDDWAALLRRIDAEDSIMPADAVAMVSAQDLFSARSLRGTLDVIPGTRGSVDDVPAGGGATILGLPVPQTLTATLGVTPQPFADIDAAFAAEADAASWEREWPGLRRRLLGNPLLVLSGFSSLLGRVTLTRAESSVRLHVEATELETIRILQLVAAQMSTLRGTR